MHNLLKHFLKNVFLVTSKYQIMRGYIWLTGQIVNLFC